MQIKILHVPFFPKMVDINIFSFSVKDLIECNPGKKETLFMAKILINRT
jgi:hypothetical protein